MLSPPHPTWGEGPRWSVGRRRSPSLPSVSNSPPPPRSFSGREHNHAAPAGRPHYTHHARPPLHQPPRAERKKPALHPEGATRTVRSPPRPRALVFGCFCSFFESPGSRKFCLASGGCNFDKTRPWLGLVDLSRIPSGTFFREVHPGSEMASQNDQNKAKRDRNF